MSQDSTIEGQPRTAVVGGEIVSHVDEFFGASPVAAPPQGRRLGQSGKRWSVLSSRGVARPPRRAPGRGKMRSAETRHRAQDQAAASLSSLARRNSGARSKPLAQTTVSDATLRSSNAAGSRS